MKNYKRKTYVVNISEILFVIGFIVLVGAVIYFISKGLGSSKIKLEITKIYSVDQASAIKALADSTVGKINNTIVVSAIFFTVVVALLFILKNQINPSCCKYCCKPIKKTASDSFKTK